MYQGSKPCDGSCCAAPVTTSTTDGMRVRSCSSSSRSVIPPAGPPKTRRRRQAHQPERRPFSRTDQSSRSRRSKKAASLAEVSASALGTVRPVAVPTEQRPQVKSAPTSWPHRTTAVGRFAACCTCPSLPQSNDNGFSRKHGSTPEIDGLPIAIPTSVGLSTTRPACRAGPRQRPVLPHAALLRHDRLHDPLNP